MHTFIGSLFFIATTVLLFSAEVIGSWAGSHTHHNTH